jgi:23S rRNA (cytidine1920-2'-O)/16S rRNA (cytidine1409-2'-O)-methyltransferase
MPTRMRADLLLVERGLFASRAQAQAAITAGRVTANAITVRRPADEILIDAVLKATPEHPWVSRGGLKLSAALDHFGFDPWGRVCLDVGASTGGFSDVLIARGARRIYAVDVGHGQLHARLRDRPVLVSLEGTDIRTLSATQLQEPPDFVVIDVSFISLTQVLPAALALVASRSELIALIKPQFESGRQRLKKGIVRDPSVHAAVCQRVAAFVDSLGWDVAGIIPSPLGGRARNNEFLLGARRG